MHELSTRKDLPIYRLDIYKPDEHGKNVHYKSIYLTEEQAIEVTKTLNSPNQFLIFGAEAYPKFSCYIEKMSEKAIKERYSKYILDIEERKREKEENELMELNKKREEWIRNNEETFAKMVEIEENKIIKEHHKDSIFLFCAKKMARIYAKTKIVF